MGAESAIRKYVRNDFEWPDSQRSRALSNLQAGFEGVRETVSEFLSEFVGNDYRYISWHPFGFGLALRGTRQLDEVVRRFSRRLQYLYIYPRQGPSFNESEILNFERLIPLVALRGLRVGYMLRSCNAACLERLSRLEYLSLMWTIDERVNLGKLENLTELDLLSSSHLDSVWKLGSLRRLSIERHRAADLGPLARMATLEKLKIVNSSKLTSLRGIENLGKLKILGLYHNRSIESLDFLDEARSLQYLIVERCSRLRNIQAAMRLPNLKYLEIRECHRLGSVAPFPSLPKLTHVFFIRVPKLTIPVEKIVENLPNLRYYYS